MKTIEVKQQEAKERQDRYNSLTLAQKLEKAKKEGGKKVIAKIERQLSKTKK